MNNSVEWLSGHKSLESPLNVRKHLQRLKRDPLEHLLIKLEAKDHTILETEFSRYRETYRLYYLCVERFLNEMSLTVRWSKGPYWTRRAGGKYTPNERKTAERYNSIARFLELDFFNCLLYARILLDRTIALSRHFLMESKLPSFTSLNQHKKFFQGHKTPYGDHEEYASYIRDQTDWFDTPLKIVRDKFLVHAGPRHMRLFGYPGSGHELGLSILIPDGADRINKPLERVKVIVVSVPELTENLARFLAWFCDYGLKAKTGKKTNT